MSDHWVARRRNAGRLLLYVLILRNVGRREVNNASALIAATAIARRQGRNSARSNVANEDNTKGSVERSIITRSAATREAVRHLARAIAVITLSEFLNDLRVVFLNLRSRTGLVRQDNNYRFMGRTRVRLSVIVLRVDHDSAALIRGRLAVTLCVRGINVEANGSDYDSTITNVTSCLSVRFVCVTLLRLSISIDVLGVLLTRLRKVEYGVLRGFRFVL